MKIKRRWYLVGVLLIAMGGVFYRNKIASLALGVVATKFPDVKLSSEGVSLGVNSLKMESLSFNKELTSGKVSLQAVDLNLVTNLRALYQKILGDLTVDKLKIEYFKYATKKKDVSSKLDLSQLRTGVIFPFYSLTVNDLLFSYVNVKPNLNIQASLKMLAETESIKADISFQSPVKAQTEIIAKNSSQGMLENLDFNFDLQALTLGQIAFSSLKAQGSLQVSSVPPTLLVQSMQGKLLGGSFSVVASIVELNFDRCHSLTILLTKIDLAEILSHYPTSDLSATGSISAELPFRICPQSYSISKGSLSMNMPGIIKYSGSELPLSADNSALNFVRKVLEEFHYSSLESSIDLTQKGTLTLGLKLVGNSPNVNNKQPVNVNLNIEENIPALLKSLRIAEELEKKYTGIK